MPAIRLQRFRREVTNGRAVAPTRQTERKQNQTCWLCEQRRTCTQADHGWECDDCRQVQ
jgi:hypothetical protein